MNYREYFKDKRVAVIGLGTHGEMIPDIKFLFKQKAQVALYDQRNELVVKHFFLDLAEIALFRYTFGSVPSEELLENDLIILSPTISKDASFLRQAQEKGIPIEYPDTLFLKLAPPITFLSIMGSYGKTTILHMLNLILRHAFEGNDDQGLFILDPEGYHGSISHLRRVKKGDLVIARIPDEMYDSYYETGVSPHVAVITSGPSKKQSIAPFALLERQTYNSFIIAPDQVMDIVKSMSNIPPKAKLLRTRPTSVPHDWKIPFRGDHDKDNASLAVQAAELFKVSREIIREALETYAGLHYRVELSRKLGGIEYYNDAASINPDSTIAALRALGSNKNVVLIIGGAFTGDNYEKLVSYIPHHAHTVIVLPGSGTLRLRSQIENIEGIVVHQAKDLNDAVALAKEHARKGDRVLFSPAFNASGIYKSRRERGEAFVKAVRN
jgi:UDP-N-acetylmuramoylalanine--D-glutamate ligase